MPVTSNSFNRWAGDESDVEFRAPMTTGGRGAGPALDAEDTVVADCAPPDYDEARDPHNGALDATDEE